MIDIPAALTRHPTPWTVAYWQRYREWHPQSRPRIVDAEGWVVIEMPQTVGQPGEFDQIALDLATLIVDAVNAYTEPAARSGRT